MRPSTVEQKYLVTLLHQRRFICNGFLATVKSAIVPADLTENLETHRNETVIWTTIFESVRPDDFIVKKILRAPQQDSIETVDGNLAVAFVSISEQHFRT